MKIHTNPIKFGLKNLIPFWIIWKPCTSISAPSLLARLCVTVNTQCVIKVYTFDCKGCNYLTVFSVIEPQEAIFFNLPPGEIFLGGGADSITENTISVLKSIY